MTTPFDGVRDDDFSEETPFDVDKLGTHKRLRDIGDSVYDVIIEAVQNAFDSKEKGETNSLEIIIPTAPKPNEPVLTVIDHGDGITRDYDGDLNRFITARKAFSEKTKRTGTIGNKGIGMFQYTHIGKTVIITSMDRNPRSGNPEMIYRLPIHETESGYTAFGKVLTKPATEEYQEEFGLHHIGTKVEFYHRDSDQETIDEKILRKILRDQYTLLMAFNPNVTVLLNGKAIELPKWIKEHPPEFIARMSGARDPATIDDYNIMGAIWEDKNGSGEIRIYKDGNYVETYTFESRQCTGYLNLNILATNSTRKAILRDKRWKELTEKIVRQVSKFPKLEDESTDKGLTKNLTELAKRALMDILPKSPTAFGADQKKTKVEAIGLKGTDTIGYRITTTAPDPDRTINKRKPHKRNNANQSRVNCDVNGVPIRKQSDDEDKRKEYQDLIELHRHAGESKPYVQLFYDRAPAELHFNLDNAEHVVMAKSKRYEARVCIMQCQLAEIVAGIDQETRMKQSDARVKILKSMGRYPKVLVTASNSRAIRRDAWQ
jgi:hypothetical protein